MFKRLAFLQVDLLPLQTDLTLGVAEQLVIKRVSDHPVPISVVVDDMGRPLDMDAPDGTQVDLLGVEALADSGGCYKERAHCAPPIRC